MTLIYNKIIIYLLTVCTLLFTYGCIDKNKPIKHKKITFLHFDVSNWKIDKIIPEKIIKTIDFIPLETLDQCIIGSVGKIIATNDKFYILDMQNAISLSVFNKEGKFINSIGRRGRGQGEFLRLRDFYVDEKGNRILLLDSYSRKVLIYNLKDGNFLNEIKLIFHPNNFALVSDSVFAFFSANSNPKIWEGYSITILDLLSKSQKQYLKNDEYDINLVSFNSICQSKNLYYVPILKDTVYQILKDGVYPAITFDFGRNKIPKNELRKARKKGIENTINLVRGKWTHGIKNVIENEQFLTLGLKIKGNPTILIYSKETKNYYYGKQYDEGFLSPFGTSIDNIAVDGHQFFSVVNAYDIIRSRTLIEKQISPEMNKKYKELLNHISVDSNPVIISVEYNQF